MRNLVFIAIAFSMLASCENVGQYKDSIASLASNWEETTNSVTDFTESLTAMKDAMTAQLTSLQLTEEIKSSLGEEAVGQLQSYIDKYAGSVQGVQGLMKNVESFTAGWAEKTETLESLQDGLEAGKLPENVEETIASLKESLEGAPEQLQNWQEEADAYKDQAAEAYQNYMDLIGPDETEGATE